MGDEQLTVDDHPDDQALQFIREQLVAYNLAAAGAGDSRQVAFLLRDARGAIVGGLSGWTWGGCLEIGLLWVHEEWRGQGYGARLLPLAERAAIDQGCRQAMRDTYSFQAPTFYQRHGYEIVGVYDNVDNVPAGHKKYFLQKELRAEVDIRKRIGFAEAGLAALVIGLLILTRQPSRNSRAADQLDLDLPGPAVIISTPSPASHPQR